MEFFLQVVGLITLTILGSVILIGGPILIREISGLFTRVGKLEDGALFTRVGKLEEERGANLARINNLHSRIDKLIEDLKPETSETSK